MARVASLTSLKLMNPNLQKRERGGGEGRQGGRERGERKEGQGREERGSAEG